MDNSSRGIKLSTVALVVLFMAVTAFFNTAKAELESSTVVHQEESNT